MVELHRQAVRVSVDAVRQVTSADLQRPTPCAEWNLGQLLAHMTVQNRGFALAAVGTRTDEKVWAPAELGADPVGEYAASAESVVSAFAAPGALEVAVLLPEFSATQIFPGSLAITFHLVDSVVHAWDVARSLGRGIDLDPELAEAAAAIARAVPNAANRLADGSPFAPGWPVDDGDSSIGTIVSLLGRSQSWPN